MASRFASRPVLRKLAYASIFAATGTIAVYTITSYSNGLGRSRIQNGSLLPRDIPPRFPRIKSRDEQITDLRRSANDNIQKSTRRVSNTHHEGTGEKEDESVYDLLVIGAGATGAGIALDAATRGLKVALVERDDFSSGTSSKSTKLVHGGVRYLEKAILNLDYNQYKLVKEALHERKYFLDIAPHLSTWLPTLLPIRAWWQAPYLWAGTKMYDLLAGHQGSPEGSYFMTKNRAMGAFPTLNPDGMVGALCYYDGQHNDSRMNVSLAMTAALYGRYRGNLIAGTTDKPCEVEKSPIPRSKDIDWILNEVRKQLAPEIDLRRSDVLSAWCGIRPLVLDPNSKNTESLVRSHLVTVSKSGLLTCAGGKWTTYREMAEDAVNKAIVEFQLKPQGHRLHPNISGTGADRTTPLLDGSCQTHTVPVIGAHGYHKTLHIDLIKKFNLDAEVALHLAHSYGDRAWEVASISASASPASASTSGTPTLSPASHERLSPSYPYLKAEVKFAVKNEYAMTAADILARRTRLAFLDTNAALQALPGVIDLMADELKWSRARRESEWTVSVHFLATMGLPADMMSVTREQVVAGKVAATIGGGGNSVVGGARAKVRWAELQKSSPPTNGSIKISMSQ
ncbi:glycerol-3-phosphate dehydrogenase [Histoplasma capsulatum H143]|uniref:glycerol-3-phosphate dehydrogenase n=1 Tax=Ajellomyces capsulatus (strain H143) TaxID=544712 RepID=C6HLW3_AJECH|nr:glycerol-3-phosphate dehydrogenase [Histoplasma capsulatum H143]